MDRFNWFFRQKVTEAELDASFDAVENALFRLALDWGVVGITSGAEVTERAGTPNLSVDIAGPATIYDQDGQRIAFSATQNITVATDESSTSTAVAAPGNEKWLSIFAQFTRVQSDPRTDGSGNPILFNQAEGYTLTVVQGAEAGIGLAARPALLGDRILLADVRLINGQTQVLNADISTTRRQAAFVLTVGGTTIRAGQIEAAIQAALDIIPTSANLANQVAPNDGVTLVGIDAVVGSPTSLPQGTLRNAIEDIIAALNDRVRLSASDTITAIKILGAAGRILFPGSGGRLEVDGGRLIGEHTYHDARAEGLWGLFDTLSLGFEGERMVLMHGCTFDGAPGNYISTIASGTASIFDVGMDGEIRMRVRTVGSLGETWATGGWGNRFEMTASGLVIGRGGLLDSAIEYRYGGVGKSRRTSIPIHGIATAGAAWGADASNPGAFATTGISEFLHIQIGERIPLGATLTTLRVIWEQTASHATGADQMQARIVTTDMDFSVASPATPIPTTVGIAVLYGTGTGVKRSSITGLSYTPDRTDSGAAPNSVLEIRSAASGTSRLWGVELEFIDPGPTNI